MSEFDVYARSYQELLEDPIRARFAGQGLFFHERKWLLLRGFLEARGLCSKSMDWLDVGCGQGELLSIAAGEFRRAAGCDPSAEMLSHVRGAEVRVQDPSGRLPFDSKAFDLLTAVCVYHHVPPSARPRLTNEIRRVLRPNGIACIIEHNPFNPATQLIVHRTPVDADAHLLTARTARSLFRASGFHVIGTEYFLYFPERLYRRVGHLESYLAQVPLGGQYAVFGNRV